jgi:hypothetical protein
MNDLIHILNQINAYELRKAGKTFQQVAKALGLSSRERARQLSIKGERLSRHFDERLRDWEDKAKEHYLGF